jgi:hypothetical protein
MKADIEKAVRTLVDAYPTVNFVFDEAPDVVVVPTILTADSTTIRSRIGKLEYQVSDGLPGSRSHSSDVLSLGRAFEEAGRMQSEMSKPKKKGR